MLKLLILVFTFIYFLTGCASVPPASPTFERKALSFTPATGTASIYVYRPYNFRAGGSLFNISLDYKEFGNLEIKTYLFGNITPGSHIIRAEYAGTNRSKPAKFEAEAGKLYFFKVTPGWGIINIESVRESEGRNEVINYSLSGDNVFEFEKDSRN
jgi:hypothetical protein